MHTPPVFVSLRRYCRTGWSKKQAPNSFISSPHIDGFYFTDLYFIR